MIQLIIIALIVALILIITKGNALNTKTSLMKGHSSTFKNNYGKPLFLLIATALAMIAIYRSSNSSPTKKVNMPTTACIQIETFESIAKAMQSNNLLELYQNGECIILMGNEKVSVLEEGPSVSKITYNGRELYIPSMFLQ